MRTLWEQLISTVWRKKYCIHKLISCLMSLLITNSDRSDSTQRWNKNLRNTSIMMNGQLFVHLKSYSAKNKKKHDKELRKWSWSLMLKSKCNLKRKRSYSLKNGHKLIYLTYQNIKHYTGRLIKLLRLTRYNKLESNKYSLQNKNRSIESFFRSITCFLLVLTLFTNGT